MGKGKAVAIVVLLKKLRSVSEALVDIRSSAVEINMVLSHPLMETN